VATASAPARRSRGAPDPSGAPLTQLVRILPRCWHESTLPWNQTSHQTGDGSTEHAIRALAQQPILDGWLIQTSHALTPAQTDLARRTALAAHARVEAASGTPSLAQVRNRLALASLVVALAVVALITGLARSEAARDQRTLASIGASGTTRRNISAVTTGAIALLGAVVGTAVAYLAVTAWAHTTLRTTLTPILVTDLLALLVGLPCLATIGGWLFAGRDLPANSRKPLE
jgi:putative ABC transport system permease protein